MRKKSSLLFERKAVNADTSGAIKGPLSLSETGHTAQTFKSLIPNAQTANSSASSWNLRRPSPPTDRQEWTTVIEHPAHVSIRRDIEREKQMQEDENLLEQKRKELAAKIENIRTKELQDLKFQKELVVTGIQAELAASKRQLEDSKLKEQHIIMERANLRQSALEVSRSAGGDRTKYWIVETILANREAVPAMHISDQSLPQAAEVPQPLNSGSILPQQSHSDLRAPFRTVSPRRQPEDNQWRSIEVPATWNSKLTHDNNPPVPAVKMRHQKEDTSTKLQSYQLPPTSEIDLANQQPPSFLSHALPVSKPVPTPNINAHSTQSVASRIAAAHQSVGAALIASVPAAGLVLVDTTNTKQSPRDTHCNSVSPFARYQHVLPPHNSFTVGGQGFTVGLQTRRLMSSHQSKPPAVGAFGRSDGFSSSRVGLHDAIRHADVPNSPELPVLEVPGDRSSARHGRTTIESRAKAGVSVKPVQLIVVPSSVDGYEDGARITVDYHTPARHQTERSGTNKWKNGSAKSTLRSTWAGDSQRKGTASMTDIGNINLKPGQPARQVCRTGDQKRWDQWLSTDGANSQYRVHTNPETASCSARFGVSANNLHYSGKWGVNDMWEIQTYETARLKEREDAKYLDSWRDSIRKKPANSHDTERHQSQKLTADRFSYDTNVGTRTQEAYGVVKNSTGKTYAFFAEEVKPPTKKTTWRP